jgi:hypothetical protein
MDRPGLSFFRILLKINLVFLVWAQIITSVAAQNILPFDAWATFCYFYNISIWLERKKLHLAAG